MPWTIPPIDALHSLQWNALLLFGSLLLLGLIGGYIVSKNAWVPRITGYLAVGFILGGGGLNLLSGDVLKLADVFGDIALALVAYQLGRYVDLRWLRHEKWLMATVLTSGLLCFGFVWMALEWFGMARPLAMLAGVFAIATAPAVVMVVVRELRAEGHVTRRLAAMTALNNIVALLGIYILLPLVSTDGTRPVATMVSGTLYLLCGSLLLAYLTYRLMMPLARLLGRERTRQFVLVIAVISLAIGAAHALKLPVFLTMLAFAILSKNLDLQYDLMELEFGVATELFIVMLFITVGASIRVTDLGMLGLPALAFIVARFLAMASGIFVFARPAKLRWRQAGLLALGTLPMAEAGMGMAQVSSLSPEMMTGLAPVIAGSLIILELFGPVATQFALVKLGEGGHENQNV